MSIGHWVLQQIEKEIAKLSAEADAAESAYDQIAPLASAIPDEHPTPSSREELAAELRVLAEYAEGTWRNGTELVPLADFTRERMATALRAAATELDPEPPQPVRIAALHFPIEVWDDYRAAILARFPHIDIFRIPVEEPGIESFGITPKHLP